MTMDYRIIIGLEVHVQLLTRTKLFCGCSTKFGLPPNSATCPVCIGMPGVLPVMNRRAFELALKAALALNCRIAAFTKWDRKNYYYPDLPKNYQISQYDLPFSHDGWLEIPTAAGPKRVGIIRAHLEEDAGKMLHDEAGGGQESKVDLNRAGTPLVEIVSQPELSSPEEARVYLEEMRLLLREIEVSDCEMQEGSLRCDANINLHVPQPDGSFVATPIVEVKNLNSIAAVERAMKYEAERQFEEFQATGKKLGEVSKATAGWDDARRVTRIQRRKEEASDYRYFPEPDLLPVHVSNAWREEVLRSLPELPEAKRARFISAHGLSPYDAGVLTASQSLADYFESVVKSGAGAKTAANWIQTELLRRLNDSGKEIEASPVSPTALADLLKLVAFGKITAAVGKKVFAVMFDTGRSPADIVAAEGLGSQVDELAIEQAAREVIEKNPDNVAKFKSGNEGVFKFFVGQVMRATRGQANPQAVNDILRKLLS